MKTIKQTIFIIFMLASYNTVILSQNLDSLSTAERDSLLIALAKEFVLKCGPDYYREYKEPVITKEKILPKGEGNPEGRYAGREYYNVTFLYDQSEEKLIYDYCAQVSILADTGYPYSVMFGNGMGRGFRENVDWRSIPVQPILYEEAIWPIYAPVSIEIPESIIEAEARNEYVQQALKELDQEPVNKDELIRKGLKKGSDGQWIRHQQQTPPAKALKVIERAKEDMRRKMENR